MTASRSKGRIVFSCDTCPEALDTDRHDWQEARTVLRDAGWTIHNTGDEWIHSCPDCR